MSYIGTVLLFCWYELSRLFLLSFLSGRVFSMRRIDIALICFFRVGHSNKPKNT